ncbi:MAG: hypothetical protein ACTSQJ_18165 [Promethearchaeota archaeon]
MESDKEFYYYNEKIRINASWELDYDPLNEISYIQIQIFDNSNNLLWNSTKYDKCGKFQKNWTIQVQELNLDFVNYSNIIIIKFYYYYFHIDDWFTISTFIDSFEIRIIKKEVECQLIGFKEHLKYGNILNFKARFYAFTTNISYYIYGIVYVKIVQNNYISFSNNYTTNSSGLIQVSISTINDLKIGLNKLIFITETNMIFNKTINEFKIYVENGKLIEKKEFISLKKNENYTLNSLFFILLLIFFLILFSAISYNNIRKNKERNLVEIVIRH